MVGSICYISISIPLNSFQEQLYSLLKYILGVEKRPQSATALSIYTLSFHPKMKLSPLPL